MSDKRLVVGTRGSRLARTQSAFVIERLRSTRPDISIDEKIVETSGDIDRDTPLASMGGRGAFTSALERELARGAIDVAVHSLKDLPVRSAPGLHVAAMLGREDARDALISRDNLRLAELPGGCTIGTSSVRRAAQLRAMRGDLRIDEIRGNVDTRIGKVRDGAYAATVLAVAGLRRAGLLDEIAEYLDPEVMLPAPGQGALAVQCRDEPDLLDLLLIIDDDATRAACTAERAFLAELEGGCSAPVGAFATADRSPGDGRAHISLAAGVFASDGSSVIRVSGKGGDPEELGRRLAGEALERGAGRIVAAAHDGERGGPDDGERATGGENGVIGNGGGTASREPVRGKDERSLAGRRVLLTAASGRAVDAVARLSAVGIEPVCISLIRTEPCGETSLREVLARGAEFAWVVLTSRTAARRYIDGVHGIASTDEDAAGDGDERGSGEPAAGNVARRTGPKLAAVGPSTKTELEAAGMHVDFMPGEYRGAVLAEQLPIVAGEAVLLPQAVDANRDTERILTGRGAAVTRVATYRTLRAEPSDRERAEIMHGFDAMLLTSGSQAASLAEVLAEAGFSPGGPPVSAAVSAANEVLCIGPTTAHAATDVGFRVTSWAREHTIDGLVELLLERWSG